MPLQINNFIFEWYGMGKSKQALKEYNLKPEDVGPLITTISLLLDSLEASLLIIGDKELSDNEQKLLEDITTNTLLAKDLTKNMSKFD